MDLTKITRKFKEMNVKILLSVCSILFISGIEWADKPITFEGFDVCADQIKGFRHKFKISLTNDSSNNDTLYYRFYFDEALGQLGNNYTILKVYRNQYFLGLNVHDRLKTEKDYYQFMDLDAEIGKRFLISNFFHMNEAFVTLTGKEYSEFLKEDLFFYTISSSTCTTHTDCLKNFVYSKKNGFVRFGFQVYDGCQAYFYPKNARKKWKNKDSALSKLCQPKLH